MFFDSHKQNDVVKERKCFLDKIKSLLSYFVEFFKDSLNAIKRILKKLYNKKIRLKINYYDYS